jgi:hypothetical protein
MRLLSAWATTRSSAFQSSDGLVNSLPAKPRSRRQPVSGMNRLFAISSRIWFLEVVSNAWISIQEAEIRGFVEHLDPRAFAHGPHHFQDTATSRRPLPAASPWPEPDLEAIARIVAGDRGTSLRNFRIHRHRSARLPLQERMKGLYSELSGYCDRKEDKEDGRAQGVPEIHRHGKCIPTKSRAGMIFPL